MLCLRPIPWFVLTLFISLQVKAQDAFSPAELESPIEHKEHYASKLHITELPIYSKPQKGRVVVFENGYAKHRILNPEDWPPDQDSKWRPTKVRVVFTKYPRDSAFWLTDYQWLLGKRLQALFAIDSAFNDERIAYDILLQTSCENEFEALQLFHGIEVHYEPVLNATGSDEEETVPEEPVDRTLPLENKQQVKRLKQWMYSERYTMDSVIFQILERNAFPAEALILDWTGSMYGYGAEGMMWQLLNEENSRFEHVVLFNDGNRKKNKKKVIGYTGGTYAMPADRPEEVIRNMRKAKQKGTGGDGPENDMEAILFAIDASDGKLKEVVLIADNTSCIRDYLLLKHIKVPVRVILCKTKNGVNHQYLNLAWKTGGSIHTDTMDLYDIPGKLKNGNLKIGGVNYVVAPDGNILPNDRTENFFRPCNKYYQWRSIRQRQKKLRDPKCYF